MKLFAINMILAASIAVPVVASAQSAEKLVEKNRQDIVDVIKSKDKEKSGDEHRLHELKDPNEKAVSKNEKKWSVKPWLGGKRQRLLTPPEYQREKEEGKNTTYIGSHVGMNVPKAYGAKATIKFGAQQ